MFYWWIIIEFLCKFSIWHAIDFAKYNSQAFELDFWKMSFYQSWPFITIFYQRETILVCSKYSLLNQQTFGSNFVRLLFSHFKDEQKCLMDVLQTWWFIWGLKFYLKKTKYTFVAISLLMMLTPTSFNKNKSKGESLLAVGTLARNLHMIYFKSLKVNEKKQMFIDTKYNAYLCINLYFTLMVLQKTFQHTRVNGSEYLVFIIYELLELCKNWLLTLIHSFQTCNFTKKSYRNYISQVFLCESCEIRFFWISEMTFQVNVSCATGMLTTCIQFTRKLSCKQR